MERIEEYTIYGVKTPHLDCAMNNERVILKLNTTPEITLDQLQEGLDCLRAKIQPTTQLDIFADFEVEV